MQFLLARVEDDESEIKRAARAAKAAAPGGSTHAAQIVLDPARWRAECEAKRRIIGVAQQMIVLRDQPAEEAVRRAAEQVLRELAAPYAAHVGYQDDWRA